MSVRHDRPEHPPHPFPREAPPDVPTIVTERAGSPADGTVLVTPPGQPNIILTAMTPLAQVVVRGLRTYVQGVVGFLLLTLASKPTAEALGIVVPPGDFLAALQVAAGLALAPTVISVLQNSAEMLTKLDALFPKARA